MNTLDDLMVIYKADIDNAFGIQCMDLMHIYVKYILGLKDLSILAAPNAKSVWLNFNPVWSTYFEKIANTPTGVPKKGDILFWNGTDGHVAIFIEGTVNDFYSFDANYPVGSYPHRQYHNYDNLLGWLRFKPQAATDWEAKYKDLQQKYAAEMNVNAQLLSKIQAIKDIVK